MDKIYLSPPCIDHQEQQAVSAALASGWVAPAGPQLNEFEKQLAQLYPGKAVLALNSGTSALHLSLILAGVGSDDHVVVSSFTFAACANVILYQGAVPVFIDSEKESWGLDPDLLESYLKKASKKPKAILLTHLFGAPAKVEQIVAIANRHGVPVIEDAAEAVGTKCEQLTAGGVGTYGVLSFNGNKIITTSGGGALICSREDYRRAIHLATQANSGTFGYDHLEVGYNYRMSNLLAALGLSQLAKLESFISRRQEIFAYYKSNLSEFLDFPSWESVGWNYWLSVARLKKKDVDELIAFLYEKNIEARHFWKPLHLHGAYKEYPFVGSGVCVDAFKHGICLPSGSGLSKDQQTFVVDTVRHFFES